MLESNFLGEAASTILLPPF